MGIIAPNGSDLASFWNAVRNGQSAVAPLTRFDPGVSPCRLAAEIKAFNPGDYMEAKTAKRLERSLHYGVAAAHNAAADAGIDFKEIDPDRTGVVEATSLSNVDAAYKGRRAFDERGIRAINPSLMISGYVGSGSAEIATQIGCQGHAITCSSSSASGNDVMGYALSMIRHEDVDVMVAGGAEAPIIDTVFSGFAQARAMTRWAGEPTQAMKPFDQAGDGFVMGEGGAYVVLEELSHALSRGAHIYAEVLAQGRSCEAYHPMAPHPDGKGVVRAMEKALRISGIEPTMVDYINVHGTANPPNDIAETRAIKHIFGSHARRVAVGSTKPITGHPLAAAGAIETVICALALTHQVIPPTLNLRNPHPDCDLDYVPHVARPYPLRAVMNLNSGFGGKVSCLMLAAYAP
jgi:3-oxoacyl-[acyl-carrier-protein] synthase II